MTIFKLFCNTANDFERKRFGERFFTTYTNAKKAREEVLAKEVEALKNVDCYNSRTIGRETAQDGHDRVRVVTAAKKKFGNFCHTGMWYEIVKIETED